MVLTTVFIRFKVSNGSLAWPQVILVIEAIGPDAPHRSRPDSDVGTMSPIALNTVLTLPGRGRALIMSGGLLSKSVGSVLMLMLSSSLMADFRLEAALRPRF